MQNYDHDYENIQYFIARLFEISGSNYLSPDYLSVKWMKRFIARLFELNTLKCLSPDYLIARYFWVKWMKLERAKRVRAWAVRRTVSDISYYDRYYNAGQMCILWLHCGNQKLHSKSFEVSKTVFKAWHFVETFGKWIIYILFIHYGYSNVILEWYF